MERASLAARADGPVAACLVLVGLGVAVGVVAAKGPDTSGLLDLRIYRDAAEGIGRGELYDYQDPSFGLGFTYPPLAALLFAALRVFPSRAFDYAWTLTGAASWLALLAYFWRRSVQDRVPACADTFPHTSVAAIWLLSLLGAPLWLILNQGQVGIILWIALAADVVFTIDVRRRAGLLTGAAAAIKVLPLIAIPLYFVASRASAAWRAVLAVAGLTFVGTVALPSDSRRYWTDLLWSTRVGEASDARNNSLLGVFSHALGDGWLVTMFWLGLGAVVLAFGARSFRVAVHRKAPLSATLFLGSTMSLLAPITWTHHLPFLSLLLLVPFLTWKARPATSGVAFVAISVVLIDPLGAGDADHPVSSAVRALLMLTILLLHDRLVDLERPDVRRSDSRALDDSSPDRR